MVTLAQLRAVAPSATNTRLMPYLAPLNAAMTEFGITTDTREAMFLAQIAHESGDFAFLEENLNYSAAALCRTWPGRFPTIAAAMPYSRQPQRIANHVYASRGGNGNEASGDGWRFRGAGLIELTFRNSHAIAAHHFGMPLEAFTAWLRTPEGAARSAGWFWATHGCNELADQADFDGVCDAINIGHKTLAVGDAIGYADRLHNYLDAVRARAVA